MFEQSFIQDQIRQDLLEGVVEVVFTKADGSTRTMRCTKQEGKYPQPEAGKERKENADICVVWDVDVQDWRTFRWDRLQRVSTQILSEAGMIVNGD
jgi:hypothetical protein